MSQIYQDRSLVLPGDVVYEGKIRTGENTYRDGEAVIATRLGLVSYQKENVTVVALEAGFHPLINDIVVGDIVDIQLGEWVIDIGTENNALLSIPEAVDRPYRTDYQMRRTLDIGDTVVAKIIEFDRKHTPLLTILAPGLGKVHEGFTINVTPSKVPRLIGKKGSMINMIIKETGCRITIGQNGRVLIKGPSRAQEVIAVKVVEMVDREAHTSGLTNRTQETLKKLKEGLN